ncbi:cohesin domain-containing protein [bacterium]|nr:cohesin domain-containing protein [bacterium]
MKIHRILYLIILFSAAFLWTGCAAQKAYKRGQEAAKRGEWDRAVAQYIVALNKKPDNPQYRVGFERARLAASQFHFQKAKQLVTTGNYEQAVIEYQLALDFDPTNQYIANELKNARLEYEKQLNIEKLTEIEKAKAEAKKKTQIYKVLGPEAETTIQSLKFHDDSLKHILDSLGALAGINIVYDSDFRDQEFSVSLDNITFRNALEQILVANRLYFKPLDQSTILIVPDNPQKRRQYDEQVIQTFYLSNAELNDVLNLIRSVMQIQRIATNPQLNAITLRDTPDKIAIAQKIIEANDKSRSEILLNIEILEVDRDRALNYGVNLSTYSVTQVLNVTGDADSAGIIRGDQFRGIDAASWTFTIPGIIYSALVTDQYTKLLATPQIRASEGQQVTVRLGDRVPIPVNVIQTAVAQPGQAITTFPTTTFQQQDVGINIDVTPRVHHNREISLTMRFELTSITALGSASIPPTIGNRTVNTVIRLKDGETNLLAGLLRRDERKSLRGLPGIHKIPILRDLFASNDKTLQEKDIIFTITPHILRTPNITAEDLAPIWIGTEDDIRLKTAPPISVFERSERQEEKTIEDIIKQEKEKPAIAPETSEPLAIPESKVPESPGEQVTPAPVATEEVTPEPGPTPPAPVVSPEKQPEPSSPQVIPRVPTVPQQTAPELPAVTLSFLSLNLNPKVEQEVILNLRVENAAQLANAFLFLEFDPSAIQVKDVVQGAFMTPGAFAKSFDNGRGSININATHVPSDATSGVIATIVLRPIKPGQTTIKLNSAVLRTEKAVVIPVTFVPFTLTVE